MRVAAPLREATTAAAAAGAEGRRGRSREIARDRLSVGIIDP
jgi:hypothetical protein